MLSIIRYNSRVHQSISLSITNAYKVQPLSRTILPLLPILQVRTKYSPLVEDHFNNPRNVGVLDKSNDNVGTGLRGAPECGDYMQLQIKVNPETEVIEETKFKAFGCGSAIASSSFATELIRGKTISEALKLTNKDISSELKLPPVKLHCSMLAEESIKAAVDNYLSKNPIVSKLRFLIRTLSNC